MHLLGFRNSLPGLILAVLGSTAGFSATAVEFDRDVAPILVGQCLECHNGSDLKDELNLSQQAGAAKSGKHGPAVVAWKPGESLLWERCPATTCRREPLRTRRLVPPFLRLGLNELTRVEVQVIEEQCLMY